MARSPVSVALLVLLCATAILAAPAAEDKTDVKDAAACTAAIEDIAERQQSILTSAGSLLTIRVDFGVGALTCIGSSGSSPEALATCLTKEVSSIAKKMESSASSIMSGYTSIIKDVATLPTKCVGSITTGSTA